MLSLLTFQTPAHECSYLPQETALLHYEVVAQISPDEYQRRLEEGWRHFGYSMFRPQCPNCQSCLSLRVPVARFRPNRSQRRAWRANQDVTVTIGQPSVSDEKLELYDRFHAEQVDRKGWPEHAPKEATSYEESFVDGPVPTLEWTYTIGQRLVGVGYVDHLPKSLSAIYFFHDPNERHRSLGTFNVLSILAEAARLGIPQVYLGYYVDGCGSLEYKANFLPNEVIGANGKWVDFKS